ncbi:MAG: response regulator [Eubacteriales bacterium]|nr:response regulator [Eubacteriales bacterium]
MQQILINFLNNSVKYTKPGGAISLRVFEEPHPGDQARVCFIIADTGVGIKKEYLPKLFKPFTREDVNDENASVSMGLGLSIAYNQIMSLNGDVSVESEEGKGSTFTIHVMMDRYKEEEEFEEYATEPPEEYDLAGCHVLIAEDNALNRTILGALLTNESMTYVEATNGEEVVKAFIDAPEKTFDCILMDMRMPKLDGIRATTQIRDSGKSDAKTVPIIGVSANGFVDDIRQARKAGIDEYTTKPIDRDSLLSAMTRLIKRK